MRRLYVKSVACVLLAGCGMPTPAADVPAPATVSTTTSALSPTTTSTTTVTADGSGARATLDHLGVAPGETIERPDNFATLPPAKDYIFEDIPHPRARIASRVQVEGQAGGDSNGVTITYVPGYTVWDYDGGLREVSVEGGDVFSLNQDGTWTLVEVDELSPFGPLMEWSDAISGYEGAVSLGVEVEGYELIAGVETAHIRVQNVRPDLWADLWVDANAVVMRAIVDIDAEYDGAGNEAWLIWDVLTLDPQDVGPLPPSG